MLSLEFMNLPNCIFLYSYGLAGAVISADRGRCQRVAEVCTSKRDDNILNSEFYLRSSPTILYLV
jgi:hypothetical protein